MVKNFYVIFSLKTGALIMSFLFLLSGISEIITAIAEIAEGNENLTFYIVLMALGFVSIASGGILLNATINALDKLILVYLVVSSANLFIVTIYCGINMFDTKLLLIIFISTFYLWYGQYCVYYFYEEVASYNKVNSDAVAHNYNTEGYQNSVVDEKTAF